ncbi:uncharacterized protein N7459_005872 [Penicillium hispanicum]|uniref:uncharacterized protein n=1 Tax=Penicillium hispanicum TaxID=1080232 RepID=UPI002540CA93|nr:uncharacterized protein N7459_005872 [Penicillium hispanicum]KAJ5579887.1 hypothetical protein N7459_005872 [Penicillium hispanicum]
MAPAPAPQNTQQLLSQSLPDLCVGSSTTTHSALQNIKFVGQLRSWMDFKADASAAFLSHQWDPTPIYWTPTGRAPATLAKEYFAVLSLVAEAEGLDFRFAGPKCVPGASELVPDFIIMGRSDEEAIAVGEMKAPWVSEHRLQAKVVRAQKGSNTALRKSLGQIANYMHRMHLKYGILSTYDETVFLRQTVHQHKWTLEFSPVIKHKHSTGGFEIQYWQSDWQDAQPEMDSNLDIPATVLGYLVFLGHERKNLGSNEKF